MVSELPEFKTILATTLSTNKKSIKLLTKLGFQFEKEIALENIESGFGIQNSYTKLSCILLFESIQLHNFNSIQELKSKIRSTIISDVILNKFYEL